MLNKLSPRPTHPCMLHVVIGENGEDSGVDVDSEPGSSRNEVSSRVYVAVLRKGVQRKSLSFGVFVPVEAQNKLYGRAAAGTEAEEGDAHIPIIMTSKEIILIRLVSVQI